MLFKPARGSSCHSRFSRAGVVVVASLHFSPSLPLFQLSRVPNRRNCRCRTLFIFICHFPAKVRVFIFLSWYDVGVFQFVSFSQGCHNVGIGVAWPAVVMETWLFQIIPFASIRSDAFSFSDILISCRSSRWLSETACYRGNHTPPQHCQGDHKLKLCSTVTIATTELI